MSKQTGLTLVERAIAKIPGFAEVLNK